MKTLHFYHCATEGLKDDILFGSSEEFIAGINRIALCLCRLGLDHQVQVICFCLMDNHVHFILYGSEEDCVLFMDTYRNATERWLQNHGGRHGKDWNIGHWQIADKDRLRTTIAYIHRNPTAAGMAVSPSGYRWSSASLLFSETAWIKDYGKPVSALSGKARIRLFNSKMEVPAEWTILPDGMLWPGDFINYRVMERQFDSVHDYQFCLNKRIEEERILRLTVPQRLSLARILRKETGTTAKQIARAVHLKLSEIEPILNPRKG